MNLVSSNDPYTTSTTIQDALSTYHRQQHHHQSNNSKTNKNSSSSSSSGGSSIPSTIQTLCLLRGIGPATASLLLSVHDPDSVLFFSDEAFWWLCCDGRRGERIKYTPKEYQVLLSEASKVTGRLGVGATEVEKVAYVLMKRGVVPVPDGGGDEGSSSKSEMARKASAVKEEVESKSKSPTKEVGKPKMIVDRAIGTASTSVSSGKRKSEPSSDVKDGIGPRRSKRNKS
jgi:hypothetical protein